MAYQRHYRITIRCQYCGFTLKDYPVRGPELPKRCPRCQTNGAFKEHREKTIYIPEINLGRLRR